MIIIKKLREFFEEKKIVRTLRPMPGIDPGISGMLREHAQYCAKVLEMLSNYYNDKKLQNNMKHLM